MLYEVVISNLYAQLIVGGRFQWFLLPTFLRISGSQDYNASNFTNINEFHEFWCTSDFRNIIYEFEPKWEKSQASRPRPGRLAYPYTILVVWLLGDGPEQDIKPTSSVQHDCN